MQTGRMPARFGMTANSLPWRVLITPDQSTGLPDSELTVATLLKRKGYSTGMSGKWCVVYTEAALRRTVVAFPN